MATWPSTYGPYNPLGDVDQAMRQSGQTPAGYYQTKFGVPQGAGSTAWKGGTGRGAGMSGTTAAYANPQTLKDFYALEHDQRRAYMQANPTGFESIVNAKNQPMKDVGYGPGGGTWSPFAEGQIGALPDPYGSPGPSGGYVPPGAGGNPSAGVPLGDLSTWVAQNYRPTGAGAPTAQGNTYDIGTPPTAPASTFDRGGSSTAAGALATAGNLTTPRNLTGTGQNSATQGDYPPINPGEDSMAYMLRIGMSQEQANAALAMAKANPGMSFQDIMAQLGAGGGASGGSTGNTGGVSIGNIANGSSSALGSVNGVPGYTGGGSFDIANWKDPGYDFRLAEGKKLLEGSAAARGNLLSGPTLKAITNYGQDAASQEYQNAYNRFTGNRAFNYGVDVGDRAFDYTSRVGDRDFAYKTQVGDRDYNKSLIDALIQSGQYGTTGGAGTNELIAKLISANLISGGSANAASTIGGGNLATDALSRWLQFMQSQDATNRALPAPTK